LRMSDKIAIVTGSGGGIGKAISTAFAKEGAIVVMADIDVSNMEVTAREIESSGGRVKTIPTDLRHEDQIKSLVAQTLAQYGRIDVLVNNAGIVGPRVRIADMDLEGWNEVMAVNLAAPMIASREVLKPMMAAGKGSIISISSEGGRSGYAMRGAYSVSKRGVIALTEVLAIEAGEYGIRVNCISPGRVRGEMVEKAIRFDALTRGITEEEVFAGMTADCSLKRFVEASEIAAAALFLTSDESNAVTGHTLVVSCGKHMMH
jgi:NAD(P)-dependent dehydrogenase (short-subunit alcohol dehydrogenase family)